MSEENVAHEEIEEPENNLMSKCKNLTNIYKSESAKAFRDVKGKIESKLKSLANTSKLSSSMVKLNSIETNSRKMPKHIDVAKSKPTRQQIRDLKIVHPSPKKETKSNRKYLSEEEENEELEDKETFRDNHSKKNTSRHDFESPSRPAPPKRPPPPRPSSPTASFSNYSFSSFTEVQKQVVSHRNYKSKVQRKTQNIEDNHSISPQSSSVNTRKETNNSQLPPRPPLPPAHSTSTSKLKSSNSKNVDDFLSDCQIYEFEELKLRNGKRNVPINKKNLDLIREENSKENRNKKMSNHSSSTPTLTLSSQSPSPDLPIEKPSRRNISNQRTGNRNERKKS